MRDFTNSIEERVRENGELGDDVASPTVPFREPFRDGLPEAPFHQSLSVPFDYPVSFTRRLFSTANPLLAETMDRLDESRRHRALVCLDEGLVSARPSLIHRISEYFEAFGDGIALADEPRVFPGGEAAKAGWDHVHAVIAMIEQNRLDRQSCVVAVGGGAVLDMVGFAAAIVHRGLRLIRVPTTTLAQNDAGIGVKNGINAFGQKNFIGAFAPPFAVLNDIDFLTTLDFDHWIGGVAEAFKVAIIKDADLFQYLCENAALLANRDMDAMAYTVYRCAVLHLDHIRTGGDPFELGSARPLDFGHWAAHKLETLSAYRIGHGNAVAVGLALDTCYAAFLGMLTEAERDAVLIGLERCGMPVWTPLLGHTNPDGKLTVLDGLEEFREHLGGRLTITLPDGIGQKVEVHKMDAGGIARAVDFLRDRSSSMP